MFRIQVRLKPHERGDSSASVYRGIDAVDMRRKLGLPPGTLLRIPVINSKFVEVDEAFARSLFERTDTEEEAVSIPLRAISAGELAIMPGSEGDVVEFSRSMTDERFRRLFETGKVLAANRLVERANKKIDFLEGEVKDLKAKLAERESADA